MKQDLEIFFIPTLSEACQLILILSPSYLFKTASRPGAAAEAGEIEKDQRHDWMVSQTGSVFHRLVVETLGLWSPNSLEVIKVIAHRASFHNNASICMRSAPATFSQVVAF